jgi:hypothetical protein
MSVRPTRRRWLSNRPREWTGHHQLSATPKPLCLPLRGSVQSGRPPILGSPVGAVFWSSGQQGFRLGRGERCDVVVETRPYLSIGCNEMPTTLGERPSLSGSQATAACLSMHPISAIRRSTIAAPALAAAN